MTRWIPAAAIAIFVLDAPGTYAQTPVSYTRSAFPSGAVEGRVLDEQQAPIAGAMVSVIGRATATATTGRDGRFTLRELPYGPYILTVHSRGFWRAHGRTIQVVSSKVSVPEILLARADADVENPVEVREDASTRVPASSEAPQLAGFGSTAPSTSAEETATERSSASTSEGETAWRLRHLPRSILKDTSAGGAWSEAESEEYAWAGRHAFGALSAVPLAFFSELPLSGQFNLMTTDSFDRPGDLFGTGAAPRSIAYIAVNTKAAGGAWAVQGAMTQGDLASWIVAGSYKSIHSPRHAYELGMSYSTQRYDGGNVTALSAIHDNARNVGAVYGADEWTISPRLVVGYGAEYARYDYLGGAGSLSPRVSVTVPLDSVRLKALVSSRAVVPGAEEFAPSIAGVWLPPERTFSSLAADGRFTQERTRHMQVSIERDLAPGVAVALRGFTQRVDDQLVEIFGVNLPGRPETPLGHYHVGTAGDVHARGWGVAMIQEAGHLRGAIEYTVASASWSPAADGTFLRRVRSTLADNVYDLQTWVEATIPQTATRVYAKYRMNSAFWGDDLDVPTQPNANARFNVRVHQALPFLRFSNADWEMLLDVRNTFREAFAEASVYDEAFAIRAPKRVVGGLLVKF
jgi:hypothetical protein